MDDDDIVDRKVEVVKMPDSPKPMAFTIDLGVGKAVDVEKHKSLLQRFEKRHRRGQSLSSFEDVKTNCATGLPTKTGKCLKNPQHRKSSLQSEGYHSSDEKTDRIKLRDSLSLPLKKLTVADEKPAKSDSQEAKTRDIYKVVRQYSSPEYETMKSLDDCDKSDTLSDAGTYTLEGENYSEEQKARMSIDRDFKIQQVSGLEKTLDYIQSLNQTTEQQIHKPPSVLARKVHNFEQPNKHKTKLSPILSPTTQQNLSIMDSAKSNNNHHETTGGEEKTFTKIMFASPKCQPIVIIPRPDDDRGSVISVTSSGAFRPKDKVRKHVPSLTQSKVQVEAYTGNGFDSGSNVIRATMTVTRHLPNLTSNLVHVGQSVPSSSCHFENNEFIPNTNNITRKVSNLPPLPSVGGSPTKIPSPVHSIRPRSRNGVDLSDSSSLETESYLKPTQNFIDSLQQRLSIDDIDGDGQQILNNKLVIKKPTHIRHNSFDNAANKPNKLEHFCNKNLLIDQTNLFNQYQKMQQHKIQNSPNGSPIRRSSSFSTKTLNTKCSNICKDSNVYKMPTTFNSSRNVSIQRSASTASIKPEDFSQHRRRPVVATMKIDRNQFTTDTESSSEEELNPLKKKDITNTRYNRAFSLRRARLEPERLPPSSATKTNLQGIQRVERSISVDRKLVKTNDVQSRYLTNINKAKCNTPPTPSGKEEMQKAQIKSKTPIFGRLDTGRFSMRSTSKPTSAAATFSQNVTPKNAKKEIGIKQSGPRSNSSLSSREVEFQNWKRRKSYDPMKAAAEGKKKADLAKKQNSTMNQEYDSSPSHSSSVVHRSQSFHGTAQLSQLSSSDEGEEDLTLSADEGFSPPTPSPCELSPTRSGLQLAWKDRVLQ